MGEYLVDAVPLEVDVGDVHALRAVPERLGRLLAHALLVGAAVVAAARVVVAAVAVVVEVGLGLGGRRALEERGRRQGHARRVRRDVGQTPAAELGAPGGGGPDGGQVAERTARPEVRDHGLADLLGQELAAEELASLLVPGGLQSRTAVIYAVPFFFVR